MGEIIRKVTRIMESDISDVKKALIQNVDAFYKAIYWAKGKAPPEKNRKKTKHNLIMYDFITRKYQQRGEL